MINFYWIIYLQAGTSTHYNGILDCIVKTYKENGLISFYKVKIQK